MISILMIIGLFAGIAVCMATLYSVSQAMLAEGMVRWANLAQLVMILVVMGALLEREIGFAEIMAWPLIAAAIWTFALERRWYRIFPILVIVFALLVATENVALSPLPGA